MQAFFDAVKSGDQETVDSLIASDTGLLQARDEAGITAVQAATYAFQFDLAKKLVERGAELDLPSACCVGVADKVRELARDSDVNELSSDGFTPLSLAAAFGGVECVRALLEKGADVDLKGTALGGIAPIHACIFGRKNDVLQLLLQAGADANLNQAAGFTPLMGAAQNGDQEAVNILLAHGADSAAIAEGGKTASDYAQESGVSLA